MSERRSRPKFYDLDSMRAALEDAGELLSAFHWDETPEGHEFWRKQYEDGTITDEGREALTSMIVRAGGSVDVAEGGDSAKSFADEVATLTAERDHYKKIAEEGVGPIIKSMRLENGSFDMAITGPIVEAMATAYVGHFKAGGSVNYMEMSLFDRDEPFQRYTVTVQKVGAKSPADLVNEARAELAAVESLRPHWANGYSSDGVAAQASTAALAQIWKELGVDNQTSAMQKLRQLVQVTA